MDRHTIGTKNAGRCGEVAVSGGLTALYSEGTGGRDPVVKGARSLREAGKERAGSGSKLYEKRKLHMFHFEIEAKDNWA